MPKVEKLGVEDIHWGHATSARTSRLDPSTTVDITMVNARHVPYSGLVTSGTGNVSTVAGALDLVARTFSGAVCSGLAGISGATLSSVLNVSTVAAKAILNPGVTGSGWRMDVGTVAFSGWRQLAVSTALSSILHMTATPVRVSGWFNTNASGVLIEHVSLGFSGHVFDVYRHMSVSGTGGGMPAFTSGGISGRISWFALGI
jgi:hypothetical protein